MLEVIIQLFKIWANISEMAGAASLTSLVLKFCSPMDLCVGSSLIIFSTLALVVDCILSNVSPLSGNSICPLIPLCLKIGSIKVISCLYCNFPITVFF